jgi:hypothetical protein
MKSGNISNNMTIKPWLIDRRIILWTPEEEKKLIDKFLIMPFINKVVEPSGKGDSPHIS